MKNINHILKEVLQNVKPSKEEMAEIKKILAENLSKVKENMRSNKINADIFVGGSAAKGTMIRKDNYDVDIFIRFDKKYKDSLLSSITEKLLRGIRIQRIHGSRDYFKAQVAENLFLEFVPVRRISKPKDAENVTDLSYS
ncbi:MAG: nucleotidyltransferase domain-containing protein, partial [Nanoarchaeota archaeon]